jgi:hypothetical protein
LFVSASLSLSLSLSFIHSFIYSLPLTKQDFNENHHGVGGEERHCKVIQAKEKRRRESISTSERDGRTRKKQRKKERKRERKKESALRK